MKHLFIFSSFCYFFNFNLNSEQYFSRVSLIKNNYYIYDSNFNNLFSNDNGGAINIDNLDF